MSSYETAIARMYALGHELAQKIAETGKQIEAEMMGQMGAVDTIALRNLLRRFINMPDGKLEFDE